MAARTRVVWYQRTADLGDAPGRWVEAARAHLPEAVPRRFGDTEPFTGLFERDGEAGLRRAWDGTDDGLLFLSAGRLVPHATLATPRSRLRGLGDMTAHVLDAGLEPEDERLRAFVLAFAQVSTAVVTVNPARPADAGSAAGSRTSRAWDSGSGCRRCRRGGAGSGPPTPGRCGERRFH